MNLIKLVLILLTVGNLEAFNQLCFAFTPAKIIPFFRTRDGEQDTDQAIGWNLDNNDKINGMVISVQLPQCAFEVQLKLLGIMEYSESDRERDGDYELEMCGPCINEDPNFMSQMVIYFTDERQRSEVNVNNGAGYRIFIQKEENSLYGNNIIRPNSNLLMI